MTIQEQLSTIVNRVEKVTGINVIGNKNRKQHIVYAKKLYCYSARKKNITFHEIADFIKINHATVIWHCNDTEYLLKQDKVFYGNYLRVQGQPAEGKSERDYFDLAIAQHLKRQL